MSLFLAYEIVREGHQNGTKFYCRTQSSEKIDMAGIEHESEVVRDRFDNAYGGTHYVVRHWEAKPKTERFVRSRKESRDLRDLAFAEILDGPDCKTKSWLQLYLDRKKRPPQITRQKKCDQPIRVGEVINDTPF